jgi:hypothetical protein
VGLVAAVAVTGGALTARSLFRTEEAPVARRTERPPAPAPAAVEPQRAVSAPVSDSGVSQARASAPAVQPSAPAASPPPRVVVSTPPRDTAATEPRRDPPPLVAAAPAQRPASRAPATDSLGTGTPARPTTRDSQVTPPPVVQPPPVSASTPAPAVPAPAPAAPPPAAPAEAEAETDPELIAGYWVRASRGEAETDLGHDIVSVPGFPIASIARPGGGGRSGIRVVQMLDAGVPLELVITRPAFLNRGGAATGPDRVTAVRVAAATTPGAPATGSARLGGFLITAKAAVPADDLKAMLARLAEPPR